MSIVYSTDPDWKSEKKATSEENIPVEKQTAYIALDRKGRRGKSVTTISNLQGELKKLLKELQKKCGSGGSVKNKVIEIQGDHRKKIADILQEKGYKFKFSGG